MERYNGIVKKNEYTFWIRVSIVDDYIFEFLKEKFPNDLILPEFSLIDWFVLDEDLPIEIQSTIMQSNIDVPLHASFEKSIQAQLEQNIKNFGRCWFFMDADYLKYLQNYAGGTISINFDWFYKLMKEGKLTVYTITYDGKIDEKSYKDFEFIRRLSSTCILGENNDSRILNKNKSKIALNTFNNNGITTDEIRKLRKLFIKKESDETSFHSWLCRKDACGRERMIGMIYKALGRLDVINNGLACRVDTEKIQTNFYSHIGLIEVIYGGGGGNNKSTVIRFVDKFNVAQYFPGYLINKEKWNTRRKLPTLVGSSSLLLSQEE